MWNSGVVTLITSKTSSLKYPKLDIFSSQLQGKWKTDEKLKFLNWAIWVKQLIT